MIREGNLSVDKDNINEAIKYTVVKGYVQVKEGIKFTTDNLTKCDWVNIRENAIFTANNLTECGDVLVYNAIFTANNLTKCGDVDVRENAKFTANNLTKCGWVDVRENAKFTANNLTKCGDVDVRENAKFTANNLTECGNVYVRENAKFTADNLTKCGWVDVRENAKFTANNLTECENVDVRENAKFTADNLTKCGWVDVRENAIFTADNLTKCGNVYVRENAIFTANNLTKCKYVDVRENAKFTANNLTECGDVYLDTIFSPKMEKRLWKIAKNNQWTLTDKCSKFLLSKKGNIKYRIDNVVFDKELFDNVRFNKLTAKQVFGITNMEQRRVAYAHMDKLKMKTLDNFKVIDECIDKYNNPMKIVEFDLSGFEEPFRFLNCFCPSTGREYFIETRSKNCNDAKSKSFGFDNITFDEEY